VKKFILVITLLLKACAPQLMLQPAPSAPGTELSKAPSDKVMPVLWISSAVPDALRQAVLKWGFSVVPDSSYSNLRLDVDNEPLWGDDQKVDWIYALVAPFPTVIDGVTSKELIGAWHGSSSGPFSGRPLLMDAATLAAFTVLWGPPAPGIIQTATSDQLLDIAWRDRPSWAIIPFENLDPRWKVLSVDGESPIYKNFIGSRVLFGSAIAYPLLIFFRLYCIDPCPVSPLPVLPPSNRDPSKMTSVIMTGTSSLVRGVAYAMSIKGVTYPGRDIQAWLAQADITHISNETSFYSGCPPPVMEISLKFCSDPVYIALLKYVGTDVVELTGNHLIDYGPQPFSDTLELYRQNNILYYGGGTNLSDARKPLLIENHGNKIAFIGCNSVDIGKYPTAASDRPGAAPCDYEYVTQQITQLRSQGYLVIMTFQYYETLDSQPFDAQVKDFRLMAQAGAAIVQGSQAHFPQSMEFSQGAFIHYGLGNLFFDQMGNDPKIPGIRREFIDEHIFYDGRYVSTELLTAMLEDYSRPRPMTADERAAFLSEYFSLSGW
jgi:poly-gamma-glutamate synthesis protein (capsule biosynthesis protein)